jgi:TrmH family RNA methyltransferase
MGAHFVIPVYEQQDLPTVAKQFANVYATSLSATKSIYEIALQVPTAFVFGNEGAGLSAELLSCASQRINIPMSGKVESLNVAAAVAVCLFERWRQINYG